MSALIDYWTGRTMLDQADVEYLSALFAKYPYGAGDFEAWLEILREMWQRSLAGLAPYELPMRERPVTIRPPEAERGYMRRPPTRIRQLRG